MVTKTSGQAVLAGGPAVKIPKKRLGEALVGAGLISHEQLERALELQRSSGKRIGEVIVSMGLLDEDRLGRVLAQELGIPFIAEREVEVRADVANLINEQAARRYRAVPIDRRGQTIILAMADPQNVFALDDVAFITGCDVQPVVTTEKGVDRAIYLGYKRGQAEAVDYQVPGTPRKSRDPGAAAPQIAATRAPSRPGRISGGHGGQPGTLIPMPQSPTGLAGGLDAADPGQSFDDIEAELSGADYKAAGPSKAELQAADEAPIIRLVNQVIDQAIELGATDIHIEPDETFFRVRYRIDGMLREVMNRPIELHAPTTSRVKIMASLDISERRVPQDGRIQIRDGKRDVDFRVSTIPTIHGEKVAIRILDKRRTIAKLENLGFHPEDLAKFKDAINRPHGIILATGPTGSGKTTTLAAALRELNTPERNIVTLEDPIEYQIQGINQVMINERAGLTFARGLRAFVRQDPNVIMVGEIRDSETAEIAVRSALTGHLVLSTIHTNDAVGAIARLLDLNIEPFLIASTLLCVVAQRLTRTLCPKCKIPIDLPDGDPARISLHLESGPLTVYEAPGCSNCGGTGFRGRIALFEVFAVTARARQLIATRAGTQEIAKEAARSGMRSLERDGCDKALQGQTSLTEVQRVTYTEELPT
jgi:type IV pilus assembly protein PilB